MIPAYFFADPAYWLVAILAGVLLKIGLERYLNQHGKKSRNYRRHDSACKDPREQGKYDLLGGVAAMSFGLWPWILGNNVLPLLGLSIPDLLWDPFLTLCRIQFVMSTTDTLGFLRQLYDERWIARRDTMDNMPMPGLQGLEFVPIFSHRQICKRIMAWDPVLIVLFALHTVHPLKVLEWAIDIWSLPYTVIGAAVGLALNALTIFMGKLIIPIPIPRKPAKDERLEFRPIEF
ncbi:hypothetical protein HY407_00205 [Candidatus Gottesmanbacteria bacterium]|nr:hypothetical protein [Candidatus Gottesmanbacteria bacterium]